MGAQKTSPTGANARIPIHVGWRRVWHCRYADHKSGSCVLHVLAFPTSSCAGMVAFVTFQGLKGKTTNNLVPRGRKKLYMPLTREHDIWGRKPYAGEGVEQYMEKAGGYTVLHIKVSRLDRALRTAAAPLQRIWN